jgi:hypothetical protein
MEVSGQLHELAALPPGKEPPIIIEQEGGKTQSQSECCWEEYNLLSLAGIEQKFLGRPTRRLISID